MGFCFFEILPFPLCRSRCQSLFLRWQIFVSVNLRLKPEQHHTNPGYPCGMGSKWNESYNHESDGVLEFEIIVLLSPVRPFCRALSFVSHLRMVVSRERWSQNHLLTTDWKGNLWRIIAFSMGILRLGYDIASSFVGKMNLATQFLSLRLPQSQLLSPVSFAVSNRFFSNAPKQLDTRDEDIGSMSNEELADTSTIPGWEFVHKPPRTFPRGALVGTVVSDKMDKTVNVAVNRYHIVPKTRKRKVYTRKFMAHDENEVANKGDLVMIVPCHRISRHKHFMLREIIKEKGQL